MSVARSVIGIAERHAGGRRVASVVLEVGYLRQVVPSALDFAFGIASRETLCEGARLEQVQIPARLRCEACGVRWSPEAPAFACPGCGGPGRVERGDELRVDSIEVEEEPCTARG